MPRRRMNVLSAISLFIWIASSTGAAAGDPAGPNEADRLFALAKSHWAESTSAYVEQLLQRALALREALLPEADPRVAQAEDQLARVYFNRGLLNRSLAEFQRAEALFAKAASGARQSLGPENLTFADYLGDLGASLREQGRYTEAILNVCTSLKIRRTLLPANAPVLAASLINLSRIASAQGKQPEAVKLMGDAQKLQHGVTGGDDPANEALDAYCANSLIS